MGYLDIIVYAAIAAFVLVRLWSVLGQRNDDEPQQPNPFIKPPARQGDDDEDVVLSRDKNKASDGAATPALPPPILAPIGPAPASLAGGLAQIQTLDPTFDEKKFLQGAKAAFGMIVEDFAKGDLARSGRLLAPTVLEHFNKAIAARLAAGEVLTSRIDKIKDTDVIAARLDGTRAYLTLRFVSHQMNVTRDAAGTVISGHPDLVEEVDDTWVFSRDLKGSDPNWMLVETKG